MFIILPHIFTKNLYFSIFINIFKFTLSLIFYKSYLVLELIVQKSQIICNNYNEYIISISSRLHQKTPLHFWQKGQSASYMMEIRRGRLSYKKFYSIIPFSFFDWFLFKSFIIKWNLPRRSTLVKSNIKLYSFRFIQ